MDLSFTELDSCPPSVKPKAVESVATITALYVDIVVTNTAVSMDSLATISPLLIYCVARNTAVVIDSVNMSRALSVDSAA